MDTENRLTIDRMVLRWHSCRSKPIGSHDPVGFLLVYEKPDLHKLFTYLDDFVNRAQVLDYTEVISG